MKTVIILGAIAVASVSVAETYHVRSNGRIVGTISGGATEARVRPGDRIVEAGGLQVKYSEDGMPVSYSVADLVGVVSDVEMTGASLDESMQRAKTPLNKLADKALVRALKQAGLIPQGQTRLNPGDIARVRSQILAGEVGSGGNDAASQRAERIERYVRIIIGEGGDPDTAVDDQ